MPPPAALWRMFFSLESRAWRRRPEEPAHRARIEAFVDWLAGSVPVPGPVVDLGCGSGNFALAFARRGYDVTGVDFAAGMLAAAEGARRQEGLERAQFLAGDLNRPLDLPTGAFAGALCNFVIQFVADPDALVAEIRRVLQPDGGLLMVAPSTDFIRTAGERPTRYWRWRRAAGRIPGFIRSYTDEGLRAVVVGAGFSLVDYRRYAGGHALLARAPS